MMSAEDRSSTPVVPRDTRQRRFNVADALFVAAMFTILSLWWITRRDPTPAMPQKVVDEAERQLYLQPGGLYTAADIAANGGLTASEKFASFRARHDFNPLPGDRLCPVTRTKADNRCDWVIGGQRYTFCCPPCIDEFLDVAKREPDSILAPEAYKK